MRMGDEVVMRLVEIIQGAATSADTLARAARITRRLDKIGVVAGVGDGFIGNRIMDQYVRQAMALLKRGVTPDRVDAALESWGIAMGPFRVLDLVGNDIPWQARRARGLTAVMAPQYEGTVLNYGTPVMFGEVAIMLWLLIVGARSRPPEVISAAHGV